MSNQNDHFVWIDDLIKRWPFFIFIIGLLAWATNMQLAVASNAKELNDIAKNWPMVVSKLDNLDQKFDAVITALGYEVKYVAYKKAVVTTAAGSGA